jgi:hypothetical protein
MVKAWLLILATNAQKWGVPDSIVQALGVLAGTAESALDTAKNEISRTPVATARCKEAFDALTDAGHEAALLSESAADGRGLCVLGTQAA